jgi:uncharacterized protein YqgV (UPF0045/DUF77 family)
MDGPDPRLEFFVEPFTEGRPGRHVKAAIDAVAARGLEIQVGAFGSVAHGELEELIAAASPLFRSALSAGADRISLHITTGSHLRTGIGPTSLHDALSRMIADVERELGAPLAELSREDKQAAVRMLDAGGAFLLRKAVDDIADAMGVSRITIYNYLNAEKDG